MIVFKAFLSIVNKNKFIIMLYIILVAVFSGINVQTDNNNMFNATKPDIAINNYDGDGDISNSLVKYLSDNGNVKTGLSDDQIKNELFYRAIDYSIAIPSGWSADFMSGKNPSLTVKGSGNAASAFAAMTLSRYLKVAGAYRSQLSSSSDVVSYTAKTLSNQSIVKVIGKSNTSAIQKMTNYYNFMSYALMAGSIYIVCLVLISFRSEGVRRRTLVSSMRYSKYNKDLLMSCGLGVLSLWLALLMVGYLVVGPTIVTSVGLAMLLNSFLFGLVSLSLAFLVGNLTRNRNALSGIVNVLSLAPCFLCGVFIPIQYLPASVVFLAHGLPTYWYVEINNKLANYDSVIWSNLKPLAADAIILVGFALVMFLVSIIIARHNRKIN